MKLFFLITLIIGITEVVHAEFPLDTSDVLLTGFKHMGDSISIDVRTNPTEKRPISIGAMNLSKMPTEDRIRFLSYSGLVGKRISMRIEQSTHMSRGGVWLVNLVSDDIVMHSIPDDGYRGSINIDK